MKRVQGHISPVMVIALVTFWLLLNQTMALSQVVLGTALALLLAWPASKLRPVHARLSRLDVALVLFFVVFHDIILSNIAVARIVLRRHPDLNRTSGFLRIPLVLRDPHGLATLAGVTTAMPGTVWAGLSPDGSTLTLHVLDLADGDAMIRLIKDRYESRLIRIFE